MGEPGLQGFLATSFPLALKEVRVPTLPEFVPHLSELCSDLLRGRAPSSPKWPQVFKLMLFGIEPRFSKVLGTSPSFTGS